MNFDLDLVNYYSEFNQIHHEFYMSTFNLHNDTSSHPVEKKKSNDISNPIWNPRWNPINNPRWNPINNRILQEEKKRKNLETMKEARRNGLLGERL